MLLTNKIVHLGQGQLIGSRFRFAVSLTSFSSLPQLPYFYFAISTIRNNHPIKNLDEKFYNAHKRRLFIAVHICGHHATIEVLDAHICGQYATSSAFIVE